MARVTVEVVKREIVEHEYTLTSKHPTRKWTAVEVPGGYRFDVTAYSGRTWPRIPVQIDTLACGHTWKGNWWHKLRSPAAKRFCQECSDEKTKAIEERKYERLLKKAIE